MMFFLFILGLVFVGAIIVVVIQSNAAAEELRQTEQSVRAEFELDELVISPVDQGFVGFNFAQAQVVLGSGGHKATYDFADIAAVEIIKNGASVVSTNRGSQFLGAAIGGVALGGVGLLAGALTGSKRTNEGIRELSVKITVDDHVRPLHVLKIFQCADKKGLAADSIVVTHAAEQADRINAHFVNGMRRADQARTAPSVDYAGQIDRLWSLHQAGALTEEEFQRQKALLAQ
ncbi:SHOCT domain-containing protein [Brevundimonas naejangsanensis]